MIHALLTLLVLAAPAGPAPAAEKPRLVVLQLTPAGGLDPKLAGALTEAVTVQVGKAGYFRVVSSQDVQTLLGVQRQREMMGCSESAGTCLEELAGAMGARFVMSGSLAKLGEAFQLTLQTLDTQHAQPLGRTVKIAPSLAALQASLPFAIAEATATPSPPPPSHLVPYALIGAGAAVAITAGVFGLDGLSRERALQQELTLGQQAPQVLRNLSEYQQDAGTITTEKTVALAGLVAGAALVGAGIYLNPSDTPGGAQVALVPTAHGLQFALAGVFP